MSTFACRMLCASVTNGHPFPSLLGSSISSICIASLKDHLLAIRLPSTVHFCFTHKTCKYRRAKTTERLFWESETHQRKQLTKRVSVRTTLICGRAERHSTLWSHSNLGLSCPETHPLIRDLFILDGIAESANVVRADTTTKFKITVRWRLHNRFGT